jgi:hypothetical protein
MHPLVQNFRFIPLRQSVFSLVTYAYRERETIMLLRERRCAQDNCARLIPERNEEPSRHVTRHNEAKDQVDVSRSPRSLSLRDPSDSHSTASQSAVSTLPKKMGEETGQFSDVPSQFLQVLHGVTSP